MLLYWGMFTMGFLFGAILAYITFAPKKPEDDPEYENPPDYLTQTKPPLPSYPRLDQPITALKESSLPAGNKTILSPGLPR